MHCQAPPHRMVPMIEQILAVAAPYGPVGLFCAYLAWREACRDRREEKRQERDEKIREAQAEADKDLAKALTLLSERVLHNVRAL